MAKKLACWWLVVASVLWTLGAVFAHLALGAMADRIHSLAIHLLLYYGGPLAMLAGTVCVLRDRRRLAAACVVFASSMWLTYLVAPDFLSAFQTAPLRPRMPYPFLLILVVVVITDAAALVLLRPTFRKAT